MTTINKLLAGIGIFLIGLIGIPVSAYAGVAGHVQFVSGEVSATDGKGVSRTLRKGDAVNEGEMLATSQASTAQIKMLDGGFIALRANSRMKFDQFRFVGQQGGNEDRSFFSLLKGGFRAVTGLIGRVNRENYRVSTPTSTIGIRGTDYEVVVAEEKANLALADMSWLLTQTDAPSPARLTILSAVVVNTGEILMRTNLGEVLLKPGQGMAISYGMDQQPRVVPVDIKLFPQAGNGQNGGGGSGQNGKGNSNQNGGGDSNQNGGGDSNQNGGGGSNQDGQGTGNVPRETSVVDPVVTPVTTFEPQVQPLLPPPPPQPPTAPPTQITNYGATALNVAGLAQQAATAALAAANAAGTGNTSLLAVALVNTAPATTAIGTATGNIGNAMAAVNTANALLPADAVLAGNNATAAATARATADQQALAGATALAAHGAFADSTAVPANTAAQAAALSIQTADAVVQGAVTTIATQNAALTAAKGAATTALNTATTNLNTANTQLGTANTQNAAITTAQQGITAAQLTAAQTAATNAQTAAAAAQAAANQAVALEKLGDLVGAQQQLAIAQSLLATAQTEMAAAVAIQNAVTTQLNAAVSAQALANTAVTNATNAANTANTNASTAGTSAATAQTAATAAGTALTNSNTNLAAINTNAPLVTTNSAIAAYHNPAVVTLDRFVGVTSSVVAAGGGFIDGGGPGAGFNGVGKANTSFVLDGAGNLVESRSTWYEQTPASSATAQLLVSDANVKYAGGTAFDTFKMADNSIYAGRWQGGSMTVTDNTAVTAPFTVNLGATSAHWAIMLAPPVGLVPTLSGTVTYNKVAATSPTDALGNVGVLNAASLTANFTSQLVDAALNLTIAGKTLDVFAAGMSIPINGSSFSTLTQVTATCTAGVTACASVYYANVGGGFAGDGAASAGVNYTLWTGTPPGSTLGATDLIQGMAAFTAATTPATAPPQAYVPAGTTVALSAPFTIVSQWWDTFTSGTIPATPSTFTRSGVNSSLTTTVVGAANPITGLATTNATTGIQFGRWTTATDIQYTSISPLGSQMGAPDSWIYGPQGILDAANSLNGLPANAMAATFSYQLDGANAPVDMNTGMSGVMNSASLTANFVAMTVDVALGLTMPGAQSWSASAIGRPINGAQFSAYSNPGGAANNLTIMRGAAACPTCGGNLSGGFTGQNYAGAILSYQLYDSTAPSNISGNAALTRNFAGNLNPVVINSAPIVPNMWWVADYGGSLNQVNAITIAATPTPNLLTGYSWGNAAAPANGWGSTTVTCTTCTAVGAGDVLNSGIYYGTWQSGIWNNTWGGGMVAPGQFHWITGPEAGPLYLPEVLTSTVTFALDGGTQPTSMAGVAGTLNTASLTVNFTRQVVAISLNATANGNTWSATTAAGNEARLDFNSALGKTMFAASSKGGTGGGLLSVTVSNIYGTAAADGWVSGNLTGAGLTGAVLSYSLQGNVPSISVPIFDRINGVAAFAAAASNSATPYRMVGAAMTMNDQLSLLPLPGLTGMYNAANGTAGTAGTGTVITAGNLTQFDMSTISGGGNSSLTASAGTSIAANLGNDPVTGISWGRWQGGTINVTDRATGVVTPVTQVGSMHWIAGPVATGPVTLPVAGSFSYTLVGSTAPTDNLGNVGTLNSATLGANFTAQTVNVSVSATVGATTLAASANSVPIIQRSAFGVGGNMSGALPVTCTGTCGAAGTNGGMIAGGFTGAGAAGAGMMYSLGTGVGGAGATVISGVAAFKKGPQLAMPLQ